MRIISIVNMKGGVAKTTTAVNMAYLISKAGQNVLLIDNDIQGNASAFYECRKEAGMLTIADVFRGADMRAAIRRTKYDRLRVVAGDMDLARVNMELMAEKSADKMLILRQALQNVGPYDYVIIDCAPNMTPNVINAFMASDDIIVPMEIDGFSIDGLQEVRSRIREAHTSGYNTKVKLRGVLVTKFNARTKMDKEGLKFLQEKTDFPVCKNVIHTSIKVKESVFQHIPVVRYAPKCRPASDYRGFVREIVPELGTEEE